MRYEVDGVRLTVRVVGGVFIVRCTGLLTTRAVKCIRVWVASAVPPGAGAVVMDYRLCVIALTDDELQWLARPDRPLSPQIPLAWLVADEPTADLWRRQVVRLAFSGQRRFATCSPEAAVAWAEAQARLGQAAAPR